MDVPSTMYVVGKLLPNVLIILTAKKSAAAAVQ